MAVAVAATDHGIFPARSLALGLPGRHRGVLSRRGHILHLLVLITIGLFILIRGRVRPEAGTLTAHAAGSARPLRGHLPDADRPARKPAGRFSAARVRPACDAESGTPGRPARKTLDRRVTTWPAATVTDVK